MQLSKILKLDFSQKFFFSTLFQTSLAKNPLKDAIRFENQNRLWTYQELETHSNAFAYGLVELGYKPGDKLGLWLDKSQTSEIIASQLGALKAGVIISPFSVEKAGDLEALLKETNIKGLLFSPKGVIQSEKIEYAAAIKQALPQLLDAVNDGFLPKATGNLKHLIHTGFYSIPGTIKFRQSLVYVSKKFNTLSLPELNQKAPAFELKNAAGKFEEISLEKLINENSNLRKSNKIGEKDVIFVCGETRFPFQFTLGLLNTLIHGNNLVLTGNQNLKTVSSVLKYHGNSVVVVDGESVEKSEAGFRKEEADKISKVLINSKGAPNKSQYEKLFPGLNLVYSQSI